MQAAQGHGRTGRPARVMVADDSEDVRLLLRLAIEERGNVELVAEAGNGQDAIELVTALRPDLLVLDVEMPVLDGLSALPRLRAAAPDTRIVMLSGLSEPTIEQRARDAGAVAYVHKSTAVTALVDELLRAADLLDSVLEILSAGHRGAAGDLHSPQRARRFLADTLGAWGESGAVDVVILLVSELVANVVVHTSSVPEVSVRLLTDRIHVEVGDADPGLPETRTADLTAPSGRGMALVEALSLAWGVAPTAAGKVVWFDISRSAVPPVPTPTAGG